MRLLAITLAQGVLFFSCRTLPPAPEKAAPFLLMSEHDAYLRLVVPENRGLAGNLLEAVAPDISPGSADRILARLSVVYAGTGGGISASRLSDLVVRGNIPRLYLHAAFTAKNGWEKVRVEGAGGTYPVFRHKTTGLEAYTGIANVLIFSPRIAPMLDALFAGVSSGAARSLPADSPAWLFLQESLGDPPVLASQYDGIQAYVPRLSALGTNRAVAALLGGSMFSGASLAIYGNAGAAEGIPAYTFLFDLDMRKETMKPAALALLTLLVKPLGGKARAGQGAHVIVDDVVVEQEALGRRLTGEL
jgi:hypothetical protein